MPGNEKEIAKYLVKNKGKVSLRHLGVVTSIGAPNRRVAGFKELVRANDIDEYLSSGDSHKKADIYINGHGVSLKQKGATFSYNRLQRANLLEVFKLLNFANPEATLKRIDKEVEMFQGNQLDRRNRSWQDLFSEDEFKTLTKFLMMDSAPNVGYSLHPAKFILEAPAKSILEGTIDVFTFDEYFSKYRNNFKIAIRRQWIGQGSDSEHNRSVGLARKPENAPWVFNNVVGVPRSGWRPSFPISNRKTVYFLMIEKEKLKSLC
jgi:hypothetical protein